jgi:hypothetical protein
MGFVKKSVWVLVTGNIREPEKFVTRLRFFTRLKNLGLIENLVFSTWEGELEAYPEIKLILQTEHFLVVESTPPKVICTGHYLHQMIALMNGIKLCPSDSFILRTRSDKCEAIDGFIEHQIQDVLEQENYLFEVTEKHHIFQFKVGIFGYHVASIRKAPVIFFWNDRTYFAYKSDLEKMLNLNILDFDYYQLIPEQVLFSNPFRNIWSNINIFFSCINQKEACSKIYFSKDAQTNLLELGVFLGSHVFIQETVALHNHILRNYFFNLTNGSPFETNAEICGFEFNDISYQQTTYPPFTSKITQETIIREQESIRRFMLDKFSVTPVANSTITSEIDGSYKIGTPKLTISISR